MENSFDFTKILSLENRTKYFFHVLAGLLLFVSLTFSLLILGSSELDKKTRVVQEKPDYFAALPLEAKGVIVWDIVNQREIFSKNADLPLPLASLTKVMTAITADDKLGGNQRVRITPEDLAAEGDSQFLVGDAWRAEDLRDFTLVTSSNDGALALAAAAASARNTPPTRPEAESEFVKEMNAKAAEIGLADSRFFNEHGLDEPMRAGAYGSAKDMAKLFEYALKNHPGVLEATRYKNLAFSSSEKIYNAQNTNIVLDEIPGVLASKTGYTDLAGGNLVVAFDAGLNRPIVISVLGSTEEGRFSDVLQLVEATLKQISNL